MMGLLFRELDAGESQDETSAMWHFLNHAQQTASIVLGILVFCLCHLALFVAFLSFRLSPKLALIGITLARLALLFSNGLVGRHD